MANRESVWKGIFYACSAWILYGVVETAFLLAAKLHRLPEAAMMHWQWMPLILLLAVFGVAGAIVGAAVSLGIHLARNDWDFGIYQISVAMTLTSVFALNGLVRVPHTKPQALAVAVALGMTIMFIPGLWSKSWRIRIIFLTSPLTTSLLLVGAPWVVSEWKRPARFAIAWLIWTSIVAGAAFVTNRLRRGNPVPPLRQLSTALGIFGIFAIIALFDRATPVLGANQRVPAQTLKLPNVVLVTMDTVRADHMSVFGYNQDTTPNLREFARTASMYPDAIAASDFTLPGHASIFTGLYPSWHGAQADLSLGDLPLAPLPPNTATLADTLSRKGYATAAVVSNYGFLFPHFGLMQGFRAVDRRRPVYLEPLGLAAPASRLAAHFGNIDLTAQVPRRSPDVNQVVSGVLRQAKGLAQPFFLFINYMDAHAPYAPSEAFKTRFQGWDANLVDLTTIDRQQVQDGIRKLTLSDRRFLESQYDAAIATEDAAIAEVIAELRALGLYDETMIVITADHGESLGERGLLDHGFGTVYQDVVHVPLLIKYPRQNEGIRSDALVSQVDVMPTVLGAVGVAPRAPMQGRDLRNVSANDSHPVFIEARAGAWKATNPLVHGDRRAVISGFMKYVAWTNGPPELYDVASDPGEEKNLYRPGYAQSETLSKVLESWTATIPRRGTKSVVPDKGAIERLKSLGYVQ